MMPKKFHSCQIIFFLVLVYSVLIHSAGFAQDSEQFKLLDSTQKNKINELKQSKFPKEYVIADVKVEGVGTSYISYILNLTKLKPGEKILYPGGDEISTAIQKIWEQNLFDDVSIGVYKIEDRKIYLQIVLKDKPKLDKINFFGIKKSEKEELESLVSLSVGRKISENAVRNSIKKIKQFYLEKNFLNAKVNYEILNSRARNGKVFNFLIDRGKKVKLDQIMFIGNNNFSRHTLKSVLKEANERPRLTLYKKHYNSILDTNQNKQTEKKYKWYDFLHISNIFKRFNPYVRLNIFSSQKFNQSKLKDETEELIKFYNSKGYRDARIVKDTLYSRNKHDMVLEIKIEEGKRYYFGNIGFVGNTTYSDSILNRILDIDKGDIYNISLLNSRLGKEFNPFEGANDISSLYLDDGYLFFRSDPIEKKVRGDTIDYEIRIVEGPQATINKVYISGNNKTNEHVIRRELRTIPGQKFSRSNLIRSQRELANLGYFNPETIEINPIPNPTNGTVDISYVVEEKSTDQLQLQAGYGGFLGFTGTLGFLFNNFSTRNFFKKGAWRLVPSGDGQKLNINFQSNGRAFLSTNINFVEPWLGGRKRINFSVGGYYTLQSGAFNPNANSFNFSGGFRSRSRTEIFGGSVAIGKRVKWPDDYFFINFALNYSQYVTRNSTFFAGFNNGNSTNVNLETTIQRSSIDQATFPSSGSLLVMSAKLTPPYQLLTGREITDFRLQEFQKYKLKFEWYIPLSRGFGEKANKNFVLKLAAKYGFITTLSQTTELAPFERFQLGGNGLVQGAAFLGIDIYAHRGYPIYTNSNPKITPDVAQNRNFFTLFNKYTAELRFPFVKSQSATIFGTAFFEAANGWFSLKDYQPLNLRRAVGVGVRIFMPIFGLIGFDYGIGLDRLNPTNSIGDVAQFTFLIGIESE